MACLGPKGCNYFLPVFKAPQKECKNGGVFWAFGLSLLFTLLLLSKGGRNPCFIGFLPTLSYNRVLTSTHNHHNPKLEKGDGYHPLFEKPVFSTKAPESNANFEPLSEKRVYNNPLKPLFL